MNFPDLDEMGTYPEICLVLSGRAGPGMQLRECPLTSWGRSMDKIA